jgi:hypothetical protein
MSDGKKRVTLEDLDDRMGTLEATVEELKAMIAQQEPTPEQEEQLHISEYYAAEAAERWAKREARQRADAEEERRRLLDRVAERWAKRKVRQRADAEEERRRLLDRVEEIERKGWGR